MKIRTGFVSNSSSSSFVVAFPHEPDGVQDLHRMLFGDNERHEIVSRYNYPGDTPISSELAAAFLWERILDQREMTPERRAQEIRDGITGEEYLTTNADLQALLPFGPSDGADAALWQRCCREIEAGKDRTDLVAALCGKEPKCEMFTRLGDSKIDETWATYFSKTDALDAVLDAAQMRKVLSELSPGVALYSFNFSDHESGVEGVLESSTVFDGVKHWYLSNH
ncbi:MAG: hypothetical protein WC505_05705 [Patescibacteria group bacterium]